MFAGLLIVLWSACSIECHENKKDVYNTLKTAIISAVDSDSTVKFAVTGQSRECCVPEFARGHGRTCCYFGCAHVSSTYSANLVHMICQAREMPLRCLIHRLQLT